MHWFDRLSRQLAAAPEAQTTRRAVLKGVGVAAVAAPLTSPAAASANSITASHAAVYAKNTIKARQASNGCSKCIVNAYKEYKASNRWSKRFFAKYGRKPKLTALQALALQTQLAGNRQSFVEDGNRCLNGPCAPTAPPPVTGTGSTTCPPGTGACPGGGDEVATCCYGGDLCCPCATVSGGYICCVSVVGCACC